MISFADRLLQVFHWPVTHPIRLLLPAMIALSLLVHLLVAYLVRASGTSRPALAPLPARLAVIPGDSAGTLLLLAARDPSWLDPGRYREGMVPAPRHERTVRALQPPLPPLLAIPPSAPRAEWVPALAPVAVKPWFEPERPPLPPPSFVPAGARFESGVEGVTEDVLDRLRAVAPEVPTARATELLLVLDPTGDVRHAWILRGSGDASLDLAAQRAVQRARFSPSGGGRRDVLRIHWGPRAPGP